ncbi:hypothetical protein F6S85_10645 [Bifidobacterium dentium]|nr:hypothetical protein [Bifidobacterium dentium]
MQFSNRHAPHVPPRAQRTPATPHGHRTAPQSKTVGWRSGNPKAHPYHPRTGQAHPSQRSLPHQHPHTGRGTVPRAWGTHRTRTAS